MGLDIAFLYAQKGYRTLVYDASEAAMQNLVPRRERRGCPTWQNQEVRIGHRAKTGFSEVLTTNTSSLTQKRLIESGNYPFEIDDVGAEVILHDFARVNKAIRKGKMKAPELLTAMAKEQHRFLKDGKPNPAIESLIGGSAHARH